MEILHSDCFVSFLKFLLRVSTQRNRNWAYWGMYCVWGVYKCSVLELLSVALSSKKRLGLTLEDWFVLKNLSFDDSYYPPTPALSGSRCMEVG